MGQSRADRVNQLTATLSSAVDNNNNTVYTNAQTGEEVRATPRQLMRKTLTNVDYDAMPGRLALEVWSSQTGVPLVVNWSALEAEGIDPESPVTLSLKKVPAEQVLRLIVQQLHPNPIGDDELILDIEQWYVRVMTKRDALRQSTTKLYFIGDLLMEIPNFDNAPGFDLNDALQNTNSGGSNGTGGGGSGGGGLFDNDDEDNDEPRRSKAEKAEDIADVIRNSIEPDIWLENGGEYASIRYYRGMLIVKAPDFVHEQIGVSVGDSTPTRRSSRSSADRADESAGYKSQPRRRRSSSGNVAGTTSSGPRLVR